MGSWSVSCGVSNIAITHSQECVLIPLIKNQYQHYHYFTHRPISLPIFGKFKDNGNICDIETNENTNIIETFFNITIDEFTNYILNGPATYKREEVNLILNKASNQEFLKNIKPMWVDKKVYDFMSKTFLDTVNDLPIGAGFVLKFLGFKRSTEKTNDQRYTEKWLRGNVEVRSDGRFLTNDKGQSIYGIDTDYGVKMTDLIGETKETKILKNTPYTFLSHLMSLKEKTRYLFTILSNDPDYQISELTDNINYTDKIDKLLETESDEEVKKDLTQLRALYTKEDRPSRRGLLGSFNKNIDLIGVELGELTNFARNLNSMSGDFKPYTLYLTPQCGAYREHQIILEEFSKINKSYIINE